MGQSLTQGKEQLRPPPESGLGRSETREKAEGLGTGTGRRAKRGGEQVPVQDSWWPL